MRRSGFWVGCLLHFGVWAWTLWDQFSQSYFLCGEESCYMLVLVDLPVSFTYAWGGTRLLTIGSLVVGSFWWGMLGAGIQSTARMLSRWNPESARERHGLFAEPVERGSSGEGTTHHR